MKNKYFFLVFLVTLGLAGALNADSAAKKKVAVVEFGVSPNALSIGPEFSAYLSKKEGDILTADLIAELAKNPSLDVLEKLGAKNLQDGTSVKPLIANYLEKGKSLGADYLIFGNIDLLELQKKKHEQKVVAAKLDEFSGRCVVNLRIVDVRTGEVIYAEKISQREIECLNENKEITPLSFINKLVEATIGQLATRIIETIWPIKISKVYEGYAYLDRGQDAHLQHGMKMGVFIPMRPIRDPQTGEVISDTEHLIGELHVTEIMPKATKAQIIKYGMPIESGFICRTLLSSVNEECQE